MKFMKLGSKPDAFQSDGNNIRFVTTELATDITVNVRDKKFYLHKFPLLSKSARLQKLVAATGNETNNEIDLSDIPGGPTAFEICAKFCYGMIVTLSAHNVIAARCAAEYLEMHDALEKGNLVYKIEVFLNSSIFRSWKDSIIVLQTTKSHLPWSEDLKVVTRGIESIASKASIDPSDVDWSYTYNRRKLPSENGNWNGVRKQVTVPKDWWVEELCDLDIGFYKRVIIAIKNKGKSSDVVIGEALKAYAYRRNGDVFENQKVLETIISLLPTELGSVSCSFILDLLKGGNKVGLSEKSRQELLRIAGKQLQEASVSDILIPNAEGDGTLYDIDTVVTIVKEFMMRENESLNELEEVKSSDYVSASAKLDVAKLLDEYLGEIARDPELQLTKFIEVANMVPSSSRPVHDGLYRSIDTYLKEHLGLTKTEKKALCSLIDCKKLSPDACTHVVQNEKLPLRTVVQVLFFEQIRASAAAAVPAGLSNPPSTSYSSSRSAATTNTEEDDWDGIPTAEDLTSLSSKGGSERSKLKGVLMPKKLLSKLWSRKGNNNVVENSSSDTSESAGGSTSVPSRNTRHSVS